MSDRYCETDDKEIRAVSVERQKLAEERRQLLEDRKSAVGFAASPIHPGESPTEFDELVKKLRCEYQPVGIVQEDAFQTLAQAIWRKQHLAIFQRAAEARARWGAYFSHPNDRGGFYRIMRDMMAEIAGDLKNKMECDADTGEQQHEAAPAIQIQTEQPGSEEVKPVSAFADMGSEIKIAAALKAVGDAADEALPPPSPESKIVAPGVLAQILLAQEGNLLTPQCFRAELGMIEQLDHVIERSHNRLMKMKKESKANRSGPKKTSSPRSGWAVPPG